MKKKSMPPLSWSAMGGFVSMVDRDGRRLGVHVMPVPTSTDWQVVALETSSSLQTVDQIFDEHSHKVIGRYKTPSRAMREAAAFAKSWWRKPKRIAKCDCKVIKK